MKGGKKTDNIIVTVENMGKQKFSQQLLDDFERSEENRQLDNEGLKLPTAFCPADFLDDVQRRAMIDAASICVERRD